MRPRRFVTAVLLLLLLSPGLGAQKQSARGSNAIQPAELKEWLSYRPGGGLHLRSPEGVGGAARR
jgi:hypothetical protein